MSFVKLDTRILRSSLWLDRDAREMFITALLLAEPHDFTEPIKQISCDSLDYTGFEIPPGWYGFAATSGLGIAYLAGIDRELGIKALERLSSPDRESMSSEYEGRRLIRVDGGYIILNYMRYREKDETAADRMRRYRERKRVTSVTRNKRNGVTDLGGALRNVTHADADADVENKKKSLTAVLALWNSLIQDTPFPKITSITGKREKNLKDRLKDSNWLSMLPEAILYLSSQDWAIGQAKDRVWIADFDYFVRDGIVTKYAEAYRANGKHRLDTTPSDPRAERLKAETQAELRKAKGK